MNDDVKRLSGKHVVLCITGSIAAIETVKLARELQRQGAIVTAVMSEAATRIVHTDALEFATGRPVVTSITGKVEHVTMGGNREGHADLVLVCPATLNTLSKIEHGVADTPPALVVVTALSHLPVMVVPAMHETMYRHPRYEAMIETLRGWGIAIVDPRVLEHKAKLPSIEEITYHVKRALLPKDMTGVRALVAAGPTIEEIDDVRFITNRSSGKMGIAIAEELELRGADVRLVLGRTSEETFVSDVVKREDYENMKNEVIRDASRDLYVLAVAASDFSVQKCEGKISSSKGFSLSLEPNEKIVDALAEKTEGKIVCFKAEHGVEEGGLVSRAKRALQRGGCSMVVANDVGREGRGFEGDTNEVYVVKGNGEVIHLSLTSKRRIAKELVDILARHQGL
ncbi:MAG TPA: bifunctional phosphopantothenoylcysteine decarboxylase/phosphopantothenate--cysteine ligase CoaBC [Methanomicrobia archaeon]|nr:bifunctional phosphopantothenoylcysteine decarboxylase/phosphopantothenate--cysteine ligase CoaBC [Methanomicrobia archaeon]